MDPLLENGPPTDDEILSQQAAANTEPAAAAPAEPVFNPSEWSYKFRNESVQPKDRNEVLELMQLGHSYRTNKTKWEQERQAYSAYEAKKDVYRKYDDLSAALEGNPAFRTELETLAQKYSGQPPKPAQPSVPPEFAPVLEDVNRLKQWQEQQEIERADNDLKREFDDLEKANPSYDWKTDLGEGTLRQQLAAYMSKNRVFNSEIALNAMMYKSDVQRASFEASKKAADQAAQARKAGVVAPGTGAAPQAPAQGLNHKAMSYDDLENAALASIGR